MYYKILFALLLLSGLVMHCKAQRNFTKGYIISLNDDTLFGYIQDVNPLSKVNTKPIKICFLGDVGVRKTYKASKIKGYCVADNLHYVAIRDLNEGPFFAKVLMNGKVTLLAMSVNYGPYKTVDSYSDPAHKLFDEAMRKSRFFLRHENKISTHEINTLFFKDDMAEYFSDYPELHDKIISKELKYEDLEIIVGKYNERFANK